jgi:alkylglycerol monooxygenase
MDIIYGAAIAAAAPLFLLAIAIEVLVDRLRGTRYYNLADAVTSVGCGTAFIGARIAFGFVGLLAYDWAFWRLAPVRLPATHWGTWLFAFVLYDFCYYWWHRLSHNVSILWGAHIVHHQSEEFNLTTALRQPAAGFLTAWIFYLPLALCGVPMGVYLGVGVAQLLYQFWPHTKFIGKLGPLDRWIQTPSNHRVHHAHNAAYLNKNYVGVLLIWDHLFGTFEQESDDCPCVYGVTGESPPSNPLWANLHYYWSLASISWRTRSWPDKIRVWFASPGWLPPGLQRATVPERSKVVRRTGWMRLYAFLQFAAVLTANQHFLTVFPEQTITTNALYFAMVFFGLTTVSVVLDGRRDFFPVEMGRLALIAALVIVSGRWLGGVEDPVILVGIVAFQVLSMVWFGFLWSKSTAPTKGSATRTAILGQ